MNAIVIEGKEYYFKMAHPENTEEILSLYHIQAGRPLQKILQIRHYL